jgi:oligoendopeptidase F
MTATDKLGDLPEWKLEDLYAAPDAPAFKTDLQAGLKEAKAFAEIYKGKLAQLSGGELAAALKRYEALSDLMGRAGSYAQLYYVGDTTDPARGKFYGDVNAKMTEASTMLLFFELELNRIDDAKLEEAFKDKALAHYRPWIENLRKEKPYQLDDKLEELFLEKSQTGYGAFNRLFDETLADLKFDVDGKLLTLEPTLNMLQSADEAERKKGSDALSKTFKENLRLFTLITNTLAKDKEISDRWRGFGDIADARHLSNRVEPEVVAALVSAVQAAYPKLSCIGTATRRCRARTCGKCRGAKRATWYCQPTENSRRKWRPSRSNSSTRDGSTHRSGPARCPALSRIPRCLRRIPMCCSTTWARPGM